MKNQISNAKVMFSKAIQVALCRLEIAHAVVVYAVAEFRLKKLHPVRDSRKREELGYQMRSKEIAMELASERLNTI